MAQTVLKQMFDTSCFNGDSPNVFFVRSVILKTRLWNHKGYDFPSLTFFQGKREKMDSNVTDDK